MSIPTTSFRCVCALTTACVVVLITAAGAHAQTTPASSDRDAIVQTSLDYIEGFYTGDGPRMARSLHPDLAKRIMRIDPATGKPRLEHIDAARLVAATESRKGQVPATQQKEVTVLDVFGNAATVKIVANAWIDYLHVVKWEGQWRIVNVLWELKAGR